MRTRSVITPLFLFVSHSAVLQLFHFLDPPLHSLSFITPFIIYTHAEANEYQLSQPVLFKDHQSYFCFLAPQLGFDMTDFCLAVLREDIYASKGLYLVRGVWGGGGEGGWIGGRTEGGTERKKDSTMVEEERKGRHTVRWKCKIVCAAY